MDKTALLKNYSILLELKLRYCLAYVADEAIREDLKSAIGPALIGSLTMGFRDLDVAGRQQEFMALAQTFSKVVLAPAPAPAPAPAASASASASAAL